MEETARLTREQIGALLKSTFKCGHKSNAFSKSSYVTSELMIEERTFSLHSSAKCNIK